MGIRNSLKAIIIEFDHVLLTKNEDNEGIFYLFPGGGQELSESFHDALHRECLEEIGLGVEIGELVFIREYIGKNHEYAESDSTIHQVEFYFECKLDKGDLKEIDLTMSCNRRVPFRQTQTRVKLGFNGFQLITCLITGFTLRKLGAIFKPSLKGIKPLFTWVT
ncbi:MAG TPA: NUDIX domain-containing protein [Sporolactobacillaceae bacterium]|nr:NUDIX domain-containing protein [Sporolactobacillaceae bacterium]